MTPEDFMQAIIAEPNNNDLRIVFADWLEDHGAIERSEFIKVQVELDSLLPHSSPREPHEAGYIRETYLRRRRQELLTQYGVQWVLNEVVRPCDIEFGGPTQWMSWNGINQLDIQIPIWSWEWHRGFIDQIVGPVQELERCLDAILKVCPIRNAKDAWVRCVGTLEDGIVPYYFSDKYKGVDFRWETGRQADMITIDDPTRPQNLTEEGHQAVMSWWHRARPRSYTEMAEPPPLEPEVIRLFRRQVDSADVPTIGLPQHREWEQISLFIVETADTEYAHHLCRCQDRRMLEPPPMSRGITMLRRYQSISEAGGVYQRWEFFAGECPACHKILHSRPVDITEPQTHRGYGASLRIGR